MKKTVLFSLLLSILLSIAIMPVNAGSDIVEDDLWIPVRNSKVSASTEYPLYPTYQYTSDGVQIAHPDYPEGIPAANAYVSGVAHNRKYAVDGFSIKLKATDYHTGPASYPNTTWLAFCISDTADNLPIQGSSGNSLHFQIQLSSPAGENLFEVRAYLNRNGTQGSAIKFGSTTYARYSYPSDGTITMSFAKSGSGYTINVNGEAFGSAYAFTEIDTAVPDGKFYPVIGMYSRNVSNQNLKVNVLEMNGVKPVATEAETAVHYRGVQASAVSGDYMYNIRLVATVDDLNYDEIGFKITASYTDDAAETKVLDMACTYVYETLAVSTDRGITETYTAAALGGNYLMALTIHGIPTGLGNISFNVTPYWVDGGTTYYGDSYTVNYNGGVFQNQNKN